MFYVEDMTETEHVAMGGELWIAEDNEAEPPETGTVAGTTKVVVLVVMVQRRWLRAFYSHG